DQTFTWSSLPMPVAQVMQEEYPEIEHTILISWSNEMLLRYSDQAFRENGHFVGPAFFEAFSYPFIQGDPTTALDDPGNIVISESLAEKFFGSNWETHETVLGQTITVAQQRDLKVAGVFEDVPSNSTLQFDFMIPADVFISENDWLEHWGNSSLRLFVQLRKEADAAVVSDKIKNILNDQYENALATTDLFLQPVEDMHLYNDFEGGQLVGGRIEYVRIFSIVALFIVLIACINFMNLATARSSQRAREIGVRKAVGATKPALIRQFIGESVLISMLALVLALGLVTLLLPSFNTLTEKSISLLQLDPTFWLLFLGIALITGLLAGSYPALYLASFNVIAVLRGTAVRRPGGGSVRKGLVVFQFAMSILLIVGTMTVYAQMEYIRNKNLGLDRENLISVVLEGSAAEQAETFEQALEKEPGIASATRSSQNPLSVGQSTSDPDWDGKPADSDVLFNIINSGYDFVETMKMELADGRTFSRDHATDSVGYLVNERAVATMGMTDPVGQRLTFWGQEGNIVGVVKDFHITSLYEEIEPTIIRFAPERATLIYVRTEPGRTQEAIANLEKVYTSFNPGYPFDYQFLDDQFEETYQAEAIMGKLANYFAVLAVFIACLGLFGLAAFTAEQRTKEIGIRKVLGAPIASLVLLLSREFTVLVLLAFVITAPLAYFLMEDWLQGFAYHTSLGVGIFALAGVAALVIAWLTVSYQSIRTALANPVDALRTE
ncbi:MAG TPA: ABC transporter permease, partial [Rhodothermales bacterium]|nr:ABC transporter permease [Rhodothermales bacterium]